MLSKLNKLFKGHKEKLGTTEIIGLVIIFFSMTCIASSYILSFLGKQPNENLSIAFVGGILGTFMTVALKSLEQKRSANKHGIDHTTGLPFETAKGDE